MWLPPLSGPMQDNTKSAGSPQGEPAEPYGSCVQPRIAKRLPSARIYSASYRSATKIPLEVGVWKRIITNRFGGR